MLKVRLIPVLYLMNGMIVRSETFTDFKIIGSPYDQLARLNEWLADELVYVDITREGEHDHDRRDKKYAVSSDVLDILRAISKHAFMPLTFGGRIFKLSQVDDFIANGADKVVINTGLWRDPSLITQVAEKYGSQAMMVGIDVKREADGSHGVYVDHGRERIDLGPVDYARRVEALGAGEILVNSIDRDGTADGYDIAVIQAIADAVSIPVIACGGAGAFSDFAEALSDGRASAVAAGNIFHFTEHSYKRGKQALLAKGHQVRFPYD